MGGNSVSAGLRYKSNRRPKQLLSLSAHHRVASLVVCSSTPPATFSTGAPRMGGSDLAAAAAAAGEGEQPASRPERCESLSAAVAGVLGGALREHEGRAAAAARSQDELAAVIARLNGELDKLLENAPSLVVTQHAARISSIRTRVSALNMLLKSIQRRVDNVDRVISTGYQKPTSRTKQEIEESPSPVRT